MDRVDESGLVKNNVSTLRIEVPFFRYSAYEVMPVSATFVKLANGSTYFENCSHSSLEMLVNLCQKRRKVLGKPVSTCLLEALFSDEKSILST